MFINLNPAVQIIAIAIIQRCVDHKITASFVSEVNIQLNKFMTIDMNFSLYANINHLHMKVRLNLNYLLKAMY